MTASRLSLAVIFWLFAIRGWMDALRTVKIMRCFVQNMVDWACPDVVLFRAKLG
jgi:hypothetical protein